MALETGTRIDDLVTTNPAAGDNVSEGDDHLRLIKTCVQGSFPSLGATAVTKTASEINDLATLTGTETLTNKTLTSPVVNTPTVNGSPGYGLVMLDTPTSLVSASSTTEDTWTSYSGTALSSLSAKIAIVYFEANVQVVSAVFNNCQLHLRKGGSSVVNRLVGNVFMSEAGTDSRDTTFGVEAMIALDASGHFDYKFEGGVSSGTGAVTILLNGYYV